MPRLAITGEAVFYGKVSPFLDKIEVSSLPARDAKDESIFTLAFKVAETYVCESPDVFQALELFIRNVYAYILFVNDDTSNLVLGKSTEVVS